MSESTKILLTIALTTVVGILLGKNNLKKENRGYQVLAPCIAILYAIGGTAAAFLLFDNIVFEEESAWYGGEVLVWNLILAGIFLLLKLLLRPLMQSLWSKPGRMELLGVQWYEYDSDHETWFLRTRFSSLRDALDTLTWVVAAISGAVLALGFSSGPESAHWLKVFPYAALIVVAELASYLDGFTKVEYSHSIEGEDIASSRISAFYKVRKIYEEMFPSAMLVSHTGNEYGSKQGASELIRQLREADDAGDQIVGRFFSNLKKKDGLFDVDLVAVTRGLIHRESAVVFNPFYRDLNDYLLLPFVDNLIHNKKCLIIVGRGSLAEDTAAWAGEMLKSYSRTRNLWRVANLHTSAPDCEVGILSFSQIYDADVISANADFFRDTGFVLFIEPSRMMTTAQSGLRIIIEKIDKQNRPTYCILDHDVDGLVDVMSHVLQVELTHVAASPVPRSVYTAVGWSASGDYMRQRLFDKQTHYLGNGIELAAVALKNQIPHVTWYSAEKAPVQDIRWIAGQYYPQICRYARLPSQQRSISDRITFSSNLWSAPVKEEAFIIAEDEFCNLFATMRAYLTRGASQSFVNVMAENYLLRDYMRYNRQLFMSDPKAIPAIAPHYVKTERNTVLRLILMMACGPVPEAYIEHELRLLGYESEDVYHTLSGLIRRYTFVEDTIITVQNRQELDEDLVPVQVCSYRITRAVFNEKFAATLKNAFFVVEDEKFDTEHIDARLFEHITQTVMPGQYLTYNGKQYKVHAVSPQVGCVLHRAADTYRGRRYYRQLRTYRFEGEATVVNSRKVMDIEIVQERRSFSVDTTGYLEMQDNHDLRTARVIDLSNAPGIEDYKRSYKNKHVLRITLPETDSRMRFTISMLLSEIFRSTFPDAWPYIAVLCARPADVEGMLDKFGYRAEGDVDEEVIYIVEDSDMDLGLLEAIDGELMRFFEIMADYLHWHFEKMKESPAKDPVLTPIDLPDVIEQKRKSFLSRIARRIMRIFGAEEEEPKKPAPEKAPEAPKPEDKPQPAAEVSPFDDRPEKAGQNEAAPDHDGEGTAELAEDFELDGQGKPHPAKAEAAEAGEKAGETPAPAPAVPAEEQIVLHTDGEDLFAIDGVPDDLDLLMPIEPSRYQKECFLKFGFDEIDARLAIEEVCSYLTVRGWSNSDLTRARKREELEEKPLDLNVVNFCDFCGMPLSGVSYDRLADGRTRCNECSATAINQVSEFRTLFRNTEMMMENLYEIHFPVAIAVRTTDARTIARHTGRVFRPTTRVTARVLGFAQRKNGKYSLFIENGSPRLAAIDTTTHELTHIWQYLNWKDSQIYSIYRQSKPAYTRMARDILYEGMAMWSAIQMLYCMGETAYARQQEMLAEARTDIYGIGFRLYRDRYGLVRGGNEPALTPFASFPPLDPAEVAKLFKEDEA